MTIGSAARVLVNCDGVSKVFPIAIQAYQATDITVIHTTAAGSQVTLVLNSDYSLVATGTLAPPAQTLTTLSATAYPTGDTLQAFINPVQTQQTQYVQGQQFPSAALQNNVDRLTQMVQRLQDQVGRAILAPDGDISPVMTLVPAASRANLAQLYDSFGNATVGLPVVGTVTGQIIATLLNAITSTAPTADRVRTAAEIAAGVTPVNFAYAVYDVKRYGAKGDGSTDDTAALNTWLSLANNNLTSLYLSPGTYKVTSTLVIPGNNITIYGAGIWASQINCAITGNPANPLFSWTANAGGTTGQFLQVQGIRFNGNGLTGASGNGHCFALFGDLGVTFANFPTFRDCDFVSFAGTGKNSAGAGVAAAGIYIYDGDVLKVENCTFEACNQGIMIDGTIAASTQKVCVSACTFDNLTTYGIQALFVTNLLVNNQTIFNNMVNGIYLSFAQETTTIDDCRFKIFSSAAILCVTANLIDQLNITNNYFYTTFQASPPGVLDLGNSIQGLNISGNEFLFDSTVVAGLGILFQDLGGGQVGNSYNITANRFVTAASSTISSFIRANNPTGAMNSMVILGNYFGQQATPSFAFTITTAIALTGAAGGIGTLIANNTFYVVAPGVMTTAVTLGAGWNGTFLLNNAYQGPGTNVANSGVNTLTLQGGTFTVPTISTGWGTATGTGVIANFTGSAATLAQTGQVVGTLINLLKQQGILGA